MTSSSGASPSETPAGRTRLLPSSPDPRLSLQSSELQAEFLRERQNKLGCGGDSSESSMVASLSPLSPSSPLPSPSTPPSSPWGSSSSSPSPSPQHSIGSARLSLSSPELLSELKQQQRRSLHHVPAHSGVTTVFSGRGRGGGGGRGGGRGQALGSASSTQAANQKPPR